MTIKSVLNADNSHNFIICAHNREIRLHSMRPQVEAQKLFKQLPSNADLIFIGGIGLGYILDEIPQNSERFYLIFEPKSIIFDEALQKLPQLKDMLKQPNIILIQDCQILSEFMAQNRFKNVGFLIHRPYMDLFPQEMKQAKEIVAARLSQQEISNATLIRFGKIWIKNLFRNMPRYFSTLKLIDFKNSFVGQPAVIIGAGPSLAEALPYLKKHKDHAVFIACDTALPMLEAEDISVDFVITVDPQDKNAFYLRYSSDKQHILIADPGVHESSFIDYENHQIILMDAALPFYQLFQDCWKPCGLLASGGSVSTSAFDFARVIGADPIILVGQDLSFTQKKIHSQGNILTEFSRINFNKFHSAHTRHALTTYPSHARLIKGRKQNQVLADARFSVFSEWFSKEIPQTNAQVIIAGLEGAFLEGADHRTVKDAFSMLNTPILKRVIQPPKKRQKNAFYEILNSLKISVQTIIPTAHKNLIIAKKAQISRNLQQAQTATETLYSILLHPEHQKTAHILEIAMQNTVQKALELQDSSDKSEKLDIITAICQENLECLRFLERIIKKSLSLK
ncbi:Protein of unknown function DUF115 [Brevinema andersonii]|uniref:6-hydroxymethylpterin diphosphokinase MptE-like domain-containing protein n=1 Tax=Brevinema andersonii TaxID=34097 RepID=A0A1I1EAQ3_BREAD|nr:6-hydroxymethylpterin diphosphokinase MptE-like protein [Brevinema andersonii]SFB84185.1 Protein of unknown function DUF115 [Brevinema andersonii]